MGSPDLRDATLTLFDQAVVSGTSFATSIIIGRLCSRHELGIFALALTMFYLARGIQEHLISSPYVIYCHRRRGPALALYSGSALLHHLGLVGTALALLLGLLVALSFGIGPAGLAPVVWVLLGALPLLLLREFVRRLAIAHLQIAAAVAIDAGVALFQLSSLLLLAYFHKLTVMSAYAAMGAACAVACGCWFLVKRRPFRFAWSHATDDWRHNWGFARWAAASHLVGYTAVYLMPWIMTMVHGTAAAGVLAACVSLVGVATMFMTGLSSYIIPKASRAYSEGGVPSLRGVLRTAAAVYAVALGAFALFVLGSGDFLLVLAYGDKYVGYGAAMGILAVSVTVTGVGLTAGVGLWAIDRPKANLTADMCTLAVNLTAVLCLVRPLGVFGAALADLGGNVAGAWVRHRTLRRLLKTARRSAEAP
jgi:O-antigen/teichoic acid export membrane protein